MEEMRVVKVKIKCDKDIWEEEFKYLKSESPEEAVQYILKNFNSNRRPGEKERSLVEIIGTEEDLDHDWEKDCLVIQSDRKGTYDKYKCRLCGAIGKRFGLASSIQPDSKKFIKCKRRGESQMEIMIKQLQKLAEEMQEGVGFDPPINFKEQDYDVLKAEILINAVDLDKEQDEKAISAESKKVLAELNVGPWLDKTPKAEKAEKPAAKAKPEAPAPKVEKKEEKPVKKEAAKPVVKKTAVKVEKKSKPVKVAKSKEEKKPGVIATIVELIKAGPITKEQIVKQLAKRFPDRDAESMAKTVNVQIPGRIAKEKNLKLVEVEGKGWKVK
jgi:hypothetical protein